MAEKKTGKSVAGKKKTVKKRSSVKKITSKNLLLETKNGKITIELLNKLAPAHVERVVSLADKGLYDSVVFHRVIEGFMAQTGDVEFGSTKKGYDENKAGMGGSAEPNLKSEFSSESFIRGMVGMARSQDPNSANSQFFIMLQDSPHLNGQYTVFGKVVNGMELVDKIKKGDQSDNGKVDNPDLIIKMRSK
jgi:cyclophilin family peptidyl-prolyl cis-trans isomerase